MRDPVEIVRIYHERTKHRLGRYARSLGYLDWDTQPDPFRSFHGAPRFELKCIEPESSPSFDRVVEEGSLPPVPLSTESISILLYDSLAISAWKQYETSRWSLRCNPSSGNLHPTEAYLVLPRLSGSSDATGVFHYAPLDHVLELRRPWPAERFQKVFPSLRAGEFVMGLTSIPWRESWKYGERAFRYCQHDVGHAIAAITYAAAGLGWRVRRIAGVDDRQIERLLGLDAEKDIESEHPDLLLVVSTLAGDHPAASDRSIALDVLADSAARECLGTRNVLSPDHVEWPVIFDVAEATRLVAALPAAVESRTPAPALIENRGLSARRLFRTRRSAQSLDGATGITRDAFFHVLERVMPRAGRVPFTALPDRSRIHPVLFVHRVADLAPGLYVLPRNASVEAELREAFDPRLQFERVDNAQEALPLFRLDPGNVRNAAAMIACDQAIAADGAFAVGMLAEFDAAFADYGGFAYRRLHWEAGMIGQVLYLEAEALGLRGTGIGCFYDDSMHQLLGLSSTRFQTLYHFTIGRGVEDERLTTLPAYDDARRARGT